MIGLLASLAFAIVAALLARGWRRWPVAIAAFALSAALFGVPVGPRRALRVDVWIDASPSTRTMLPRDHASVRALARRLAPEATLRFLSFAGATPRPTDESIGEIDATRTLLPAKTDADAVILFSDGQFDVPREFATPVVAVGFDAEASDARVVDASATRAIVERAGGRTLTTADASVAIEKTELPRLVVPGPIANGVVAINGGDPWPENDRLTINDSRSRGERWWIGDAAPDGFRSIDPKHLPPADAWLGVRVLVIRNTPAGAFDQAGRQQIARFVRDLGGSLVIVGGDHAFSAGGYAGSELDALSPLSSEPAGPPVPLMVLVDASGSMASIEGDGRSRLDHAIDAARGVIDDWPGDVAAASVADGVREWPADEGKPRPTDARAGGPTNLDAALAALLAKTDRPRRVLIVSDGEATFADLDATIRALRDARATVDWLSLGGNTSPLARLVSATGGRTVAAGASAEWRERALELSRGARGEAMRAGPIRVTTDRHSFDVPAANVVSLRDRATAIARDADGRALAAAQFVGAGRVTAIAFDPPADFLNEQLAALDAPSGDGRLAWRDSPDALDLFAIDPTAGPMSELKLSVELDGVRRPMPLVAPGEYRLPIERRSSPRVAAIFDEAGRRVATRSIAGRYDAEFDAIGVNVEHLRQLATLSGGAFVRADEAQPLAMLRSRWIARPGVWRVVAIAAILVALPFDWRRIAARLKRS